MRPREALEAIYPELERRIVVTIMGALAAELYALGHRPNFFYLEHAMGLASSMGLRRAAPDDPRGTLDPGALQAREPPPHRLRQREHDFGGGIPDGDGDRDGPRGGRQGGRG